MSEIKNKLEDILEEIGQELETGAELISGETKNDKITEFQAAANSIREQLKRVEEEGRVMRLGIAGQVKAGKSSFLNALLFEGQEILPKAATPMTAALTRIRYSRTPQAKVVFYEEADWNSVESYARRYTEKLNKYYQEYLDKLRAEQKKSESFLSRAVSYLQDDDRQETTPSQMTLAEFEAANRSRMSEEERSCQEIYQMAQGRLSAVELQQCLGQEKLLQADMSASLMDQLNDFVGAHGQYTPIVKYTELELDLPELEGVEIIDTPGMNDPISSRGRTTKNFLKECDAIFLLSYCGQFLSDEDMQVITRMLPEEGVARCVLIGTKMDSAILQYPRPRKGALTFSAAWKGTRTNCREQAKENIGKCNSEVQKLLRSQDSPNGDPNVYLTSTLAFNAGKKLEKGQPLSSDERLMADNLTGRFADFQANAETLLGLSQIQRIQKEVYPAIRSDKGRIIAESMQNTRQGQRGKFLRILEDIRSETLQLQKDLRNSDVDQLQAKLRFARESLDSARAAVSAIFDTASVRVEKKIIPALQVDVRTEVNNHLFIEVTSKTETKHHRSHSGGFLGFGGKTEHWDEHITTYTANVADVERNIRTSYTNILRLTQEAMDNAIKLDEVREQVKDTILKAFDASDRNFDENAILIPINNALERLTIAKIEVNLEKFLSMLDQELSGDPTYENGFVKNDAIPLLKRAQERVITALVEEVCREIGDQGEKIAHNLEEQAGVFIDQITEKLESNNRKVEAMIQDKENNLKKLDSFLTTLTTAKKRIQEQ
ncbi:MAG: dynamin family protein [bacterium]|nr:dynamin family protein [bacterium]